MQRFLKNPLNDQTFSLGQFCLTYIVKKRLLEWALSQSDSCAHKRKFGHTKIPVICRHRGKTMCERSKTMTIYLQAKQRDFRFNQSCQHLDLGLLASRTVRIYICFVCHPV